MAGALLPQIEGAQPPDYGETRERAFDASEPVHQVPVLVEGIHIGQDLIGLFKNSISLGVKKACRTEMIAQGRQPIADNSDFIVLQTSRGDLLENSRTYRAALIELVRDTDFIARHADVRLAGIKGHADV